MDRDQAESILTSLKKLFEQLKERKVNLSYAPKQNDDESSVMLWTLIGAIRNIWQEIENIIGAELRGTKLLTSIWSQAPDICTGTLDVLDYDNKVAFGTESGLSVEMKKCIEEAHRAMTTFVQMKTQIDEEKKRMKHFIETSLKKAMGLHKTVLFCPFEETRDIKMKLYGKCNGNDLIYSVFLTKTIIKRCVDKLHERHPTLLKDTSNNGCDEDLHTKAPNTCTAMDIDNDDQMPLVSNRSDPDLGAVGEILCKALQNCNVDGGKLQEMSLMRMAEEIDRNVIELNQRLKQPTTEMEEKRTEIEKLKEAKLELSNNVTKSDPDLGAVGEILCKALQNCNVDGGKLQEKSLIKMAEEIDRNVIELNQRYGVLNAFMRIYGEFR